MQLTDTERATMVGILATFHTEAKQEGTIGHGIDCINRAMEKIDRLLTTRAVPTVPDKDTVEQLTALVAHGSDNKYAVTNARAKVKSILSTVVPEPDSDAVERAAKGIWDYERKHTDWEPWEELPKNYGKNGTKGQAHYRDMARAALTAAAGRIAAQKLNEQEAT